MEPVLIPIVIADLFLLFVMSRQIVRIIKIANGKEEGRADRIWEILFVCLLPPLGIFLTQDKCGEHPFDLASLPTTFTVWFLFAFAHFASKYYKQKLSPGLLLLISAALVMGFFFCLAICLHFIPLGVVLLFPFFNVLFLSPLFCLIHLFVEIKDLQSYFSTRAGQGRDDERSSGATFNRLLKKYHLVFSFYVLSPFLVLIQAFLYLFGQKADSLIRQFTESCGFLLSYQQSCSCGGDHYLCSIAANGDLKLVKPIRMGIRKNEKILVNRQLLVANAFEHWLEEHTPRFHKCVRNLYDGMGIQVNTWSKRKNFANVLYLFMKPVEWLFLLWLYLFDREPENRIARQYLSKKELDHFIKNKSHECTH